MSDLYRHVYDLGDSTPVIECRTALWQLREELYAEGRRRAAAALDIAIEQLDLNLLEWEVHVDGDPVPRRITGANSVLKMLTVEAADVGDG